MAKVITFGEIMLRLATPGYLRFSQTRQFEATFGGGEANVAVSLANYGMEAEFVTRFPKNDIAASCIKDLHSYGVGTKHCIFGGDRLGIYFLETGAVARPSKVVYDRAHSSISAATAADFDFDNNVLRISKSESDNDDMETKNTYSDRTMPLFPETQELVKEYLANHNEKRPFYHTKNYISKVLNEILDKLNISDITMHSLRHTFITRCQEKNVQLYIIQMKTPHHPPLLLAV